METKLKFDDLQGEISEFVKQHGADANFLRGFFFKKLKEVENELNSIYGGNIPKKQAKKFAVMVHNIRHEIDMLGEK